MAPLIRCSSRAARFVLRGGLVALLAMWGAFKFTALEAEAIRPLVEQARS